VAAPAQEKTEMADLDRAEIVALLGRLGAPDPETVVAAARELDRKVREAGLTWDDLLRPQWQAADGNADGEEAAPQAASADEAPVADVGGSLDAGKAEALRLIGRLMARKDISSNLRQELTDLKRSIADGSLDAMDSRYIRALAKRLGVT
jgi:hypothetical protein